MDAVPSVVVEGPTNVNVAAGRNYQLGKVWRRKGNLAFAERSFSEALAADPNFGLAHLELAELRIGAGDTGVGLEHARAAHATVPAARGAQHWLVEALSRLGSLEEAFDIFELVRLDSRDLTIGSDEILCCTVARNEALRLPHFLDHHRKLGVDRFLIVDNGSTDETCDYLLSQPDVHVWSSTFSFRQTASGSGWFEVLLHAYGRGNWVLTVDADELFVYEDFELRNLAELCSSLGDSGFRAMEGLLLDMYSDHPVSATRYEPGTPFCDTWPFFDREFFDTRSELGGPYRNLTVFTGGVRRRVFGPDPGYYLSKVPLIRYDTDCILSSGQHSTNLDRSQIAEASCCLLHFKFLPNLAEVSAQEVVRSEHADDAAQYGAYRRSFHDDESLILYDPDFSERFLGSQQLVELGILRPGAFR